MGWLSRERTPCPHCGRDTQTASDGVCVECWGDKSRKPIYPPGKRPAPEPPRRRGGGGSILDDLFDGCCWWPALASVAIVGLLAWVLVS